MTDPAVEAALAEAHRAEWAGCSPRRRPYRRALALTANELEHAFLAGRLAAVQ